MRRSQVRLAYVSFALLAACSSGSKAGQAVGPVYGNDSGGDVATDFLPDAHALLFDAPDDHGGIVISLEGGGGGQDSGHPVDATTMTKIDAGDATTMMTTPDAGADVATPVPDATAPVPDATTHDSSAGDGAHADAHTTSGSDASDAQATGPTDCPSGTGTLALVGGTATQAFGAVSIDGAAWKVTTFANGSVSAAPALLAFNGGFLGVYTRTTTDYLQSTLFSSSGTVTGWTIPSIVPAISTGDASATEYGTPGLAALGSNAELVYEGTNNKYYHGVYSGSAWGAANDPVGGSGSMQDYGPTLPAAAVVGSTLYVAYDGGNGGLYVDSWTSGGGWAGAKGITGAGVGSVPPTLIALTGGTTDLMLVFEVPTTNVLYSVVHTAGATGGTWSAPVLVASVANATSAVSLAPLASGGAVMVYKGATNSLPYSSVYSPSATPAWTVPAEIYASSPALLSSPTVAAGTCGVDAVAALAEAAGAQIVTLKSGVWSSPILVPGTAQSTYATVATSP